MKYPFYLLFSFCVLLTSSCGKDKPNPNEPENPPGKTELWNEDKIVRLENKSENLSSSQVYTYDSQGRETSYTSYINNEISTEYKNYSYNGMVCTYDGYANGVYGYKTTIEFYDESWNRGKIKRSSNEFSGSIPTIHSEYQYDDQDRLTGIKSYEGNMLRSENKNYQYGTSRVSNDYYNYELTGLNRTNVTEYVYHDTETIKKEYEEDSSNYYSEWRYDIEGREVGYVKFSDGKRHCPKFCVNYNSGLEDSSYFFTFKQQNYGQCYGKARKTSSSSLRATKQRVFESI